MTAALPLGRGRSRLDYVAKINVNAGKGEEKLGRGKTHPARAKVDGSESYKALSKKHSLEASHHIHPPYQGWDDPEID
jgi:hypothetical protein